MFVSGHSVENITVWTGGGASKVCGKTEHPEYNKHSLHRDIAVLHLCTQINLTEGTVTSFNLQCSSENLIITYLQVWDQSV